ncbi:hypothetical protein [Neorhodopirellula lusitana]|uniref:hypothetical protein n=1 Tax=Neorhodopirellula lusitana TaxID=445327 RepID=UPI0024B6F573|nr:hypothetical protein [Neorhodopirellula lusitana]
MKSISSSDAGKTIRSELNHEIESHPEAIREIHEAFQWYCEWRKDVGTTICSLLESTSLALAAGRLLIEILTVSGDALAARVSCGTRS